MRSQPVRSLLICLGLAVCMSLPPPVAAAGRIGRAPARTRAFAPAGREEGGPWVVLVSYLVKLLVPAAGADSTSTTTVLEPPPPPSDSGTPCTETDQGATLDPNG